MNFDQAIGNELEWRQPENCRRFHQLIANGEEIATLHFEKTCGSLAAGQWGSREWTFKRTGMFSPRITVREAGSKTDIAIFTPSWGGGGWVSFISGRRYQLRQTNFWGTESAWEAPDATAVVTLSGSCGLFKHSGAVQVIQAVAALPETPVLLLLIWYVRLLTNEDAASTAATTATIIAACS